MPISYHTGVPLDGDKPHNVWHVSTEEIISDDFHIVWWNMVYLWLIYQDLTIKTGDLFMAMLNYQRVAMQNTTRGCSSQHPATAPLGVLTDREMWPWGVQRVMMALGNHEPYPNQLLVISFYLHYNRPTSAFIFLSRCFWNFDEFLCLLETTHIWDHQLAQVLPMRSANPTLRFDDKTNLGSGHTEIYKALRGFGLVRSFGALLILPTRAMRVTFVLDCIWLTSPCSYPVRDLPRKKV